MCDIRQHTQYTQTYSYTSLFNPNNHSTQSTLIHIMRLFLLRVFGKVNVDYGYKISESTINFYH